ncbi:YegS/Rv2252/BmrU family lipid kinase [Garciella nitratireducens]|uniref:Lipid kinase, YegS/Rv2252/BmrU family n=1 Tax=Garciella nitratireducens DSM 15102 TaxID=1121911 RepID=A0A1T4KKN1_9FIRM|nr:YegS/Rv2252/BmrU family lipid kinase [Garciella nitratireducens]SJZ42923.1 lipid kinase, YegS/Rv2252/BmrU family [Garciella nitratireducens DSM 15102]
MKRVKLIYNPIAGDRSFRSQLDKVVEKFQSNGYYVEIFRTIKDKKVILEDFLGEFVDSNTIIAVSGGDGTVNQVVNIMMKKNIEAPLGIFPMGTSNDLGEFLGMPKNISRCCDIIMENSQLKIDVGQINDRYFVNVATGGLVANVPQSTNVRLKNTLGKLAYYLKGLEEIPSFRPISILLESKEYTYKGKILLFLILNSQSAGGFKKIAPKAKINDGKFDVIVFKNTSWSVLAKLFLKLLRGEHINDSNVVFFQTDKLLIQPLYEDKEVINIDIDGEIGPDLPLNIQIRPQSLNMILPKKRKKELNLCKKKNNLSI